MTGMANIQGLRLNAPSRAAVMALRVPAAVSGDTYPAMANIIRAIAREGIVVISIYRICVKRGTSEDVDASTVVSERGEILSPK